jgi:hypothetical protein
MDKIDPSFKKVHALLTADFIKGFDLSSVIHLKLFSRDGEIPKDKYSFDLVTMTISFSEEISRMSDIYIAVYLARAPYEALVEAAKKKKNYFNGNFLGTIIGMVNNKRVRFLVKSFTSDSEKYTSDVSKALRVQTQYGPGYVSLKDISDDKDLYRVCVGYDSENNPIIKTLEIGR